MTTTEFFKHQLDDAGGQIAKSVAGLSDEHADARLHAKAMTIKEQIGHVGDAYDAVVTEAQGGKFDWSTVTAPTGTLAETIESSMQKRAKAVEAVLGSSDEATLKLGHGFIIGHDYYHVGQIVTARIHLEPEWNSYSIYG